MVKSYVYKFLCFIGFSLVILGVGLHLSPHALFAGGELDRDSAFTHEYNYDWHVPEGYFACTNWNILGVIVRHVDVNLGHNRHAQISMSARDITTATNRFRDLETTLNNMSNGQMTANVTTIIINTPLTHVSPTFTTMGTNGYAPRPPQLTTLVSAYVDPADFDHIMFFLRTQCVDARFSIPTAWAGLYQGIHNGTHFSQVLFSVSRNCTWHTNAIFPERILVHEFLHGLERVSWNRGITLPSSIDSPRSLYGYGTSRLELARFYRDFMNRNIRTANGNIGLVSISYKILRPVTEWRCFTSVVDKNQNA